MHPPTPILRFCMLCACTTWHAGDVCENDPRHPAYDLRPPRQAACFTRHADAQAPWWQDVAP